jgi:hypothetical protein
VSLTKPLGLTLILLSSPSALLAQQTVAPGGAITISQPSGSGTSCRIAGVSTPCILRFANTGIGGPTTVTAHYDQLLPNISIPNYAAASLFADFVLSGPPGSFVDVQISTKFDFDGELFGGGAYKSAASLNLHVTDVTGGANTAVASHTLFEQERSGDQGFTDVSGGSEVQVVPDSVSAFTVKLKRGRTYRLTFEVEVLGEALVVGKTIASATATWQHSIVRADEDEVDLLGQHDTGIHAALTAHDLAIRTQLATHDADIKRELAEIKKKLDDQQALLEEIKKLLLTPQGRREGFPIK